MKIKTGSSSFVVVSALLALGIVAAPAAGADTPRLPVLPEDLFAAPATAPGAQQGPTRVGELAAAELANPDVAPTAGGEAPELVWSRELTHAGATYVAPHFGHVNLPAGAALVVRSPDGSRIWDYTGTGKAGLGVEGGFWGVHIPGDTAVLEIYSTHPVGAGAVRVDGYAHGFADPFQAPLQAEIGEEAICGVDDSDWAQCYQSSEPTIYDESRAVLRLLIGGTSACTGWLVGSEGHVFTNEHCIGTSNDAQNTDYEVMAEGSCSTDCSSFGACPGTILANSGTLVRSDASLDYSLILLPTNPTGTYGYMQMRGGGAVIDERIYIPGHPQAWGKRISVESTDSSDESGFCEVYTTSTTPCSGGPGDTGYFCDTQGGSSGSPVVAYSDHLVVSLHHCANCPNRGVPVEAIISDLGSDVPADAVVGDVPPPPECKAKGELCSADSECCSEKCRGRPGGMTCK